MNQSQENMSKLEVQACYCVTHTQEKWDLLVAVLHYF